MANNVRRPAISGTSRAQEVERKQQALSFLTNQRSTFAINILANLIKDKSIDLGNYEQFVDLSVKMADRLMDRLYAVNEEEGK